MASKLNRENRIQDREQRTQKEKAVLLEETQKVQRILASQEMGTVNN